MGECLETLKEENEKLKAEVKRHRATIRSLKHQIKEITTYKQDAGWDN